MVFCLEETKYIPSVIEGHDATPQTQDEGTLEKVNSTTKAQVRGSISVDATEAAQNQRRRIVEIDHSIPMYSYKKRLALYTPDSPSAEKRSIWAHIYQPFQILFTFPAVMFTALQYGFLIAMLAVLAVTQASLYPFEPYNFSAAGVGNMNIPPAIGAIIGSVFGGPINDYFILQVAKRRGGIYEPETRLWLFLIPGFCMPIGLFMYGLTISKGMAWQINAVGAGFIGAAIGGCGDISLTYCQDCYQYVSSPLIHTKIHLTDTNPITDPRRRTDVRGVRAQHYLDGAGVCHHALDGGHGRLQHVCAARLPFHRHRPYLRAPHDLGTELEGEIGGKV